MIICIVNAEKWNYCIYWKLNTQEVPLNLNGEPFNSRSTESLVSVQQLLSENKSHAVCYVCLKQINLHTEHTPLAWRNMLCMFLHTDTSNSICCYSSITNCYFLRKQGKKIHIWLWCLFPVRGKWREPGTEHRFWDLSCTWVVSVATLFRWFITDKHGGLQGCCHGSKRWKQQISLFFFFFFLLLQNWKFLFFLMRNQTVNLNLNLFFSAKTLPHKKQTLKPTRWIIQHHSSVLSSVEKMVWNLLKPGVKCMF